MVFLDTGYILRVKTMVEFLINCVLIFSFNFHVWQISSPFAPLSIFDDITCKEKYKRSKFILKYTVLHIIRQVLFWAGNQSSHKIWVPFTVPHKYLTDLIGDEKKMDCEFSNLGFGRFKKCHFFKSTNSYSAKFQDLVLVIIE